MPCAAPPHPVSPGCDLLGPTVPAAGAPGCRYVQEPYGCPRPALGLCRGGHRCPVPGDSTVKQSCDLPRVLSLSPRRAQPCPQTLGTVSRGLVAFLGHIPKSTAEGNWGARRGPHPLWLAAACPRVPVSP